MDESDLYLWLKLSSLIILLVASAFFSGSETALFSLSELKVREFGRLPKTRVISRLLSSPRKLLINLLLWNTVVNILASALAASIAIDICYAMGVSKAIGVGITVGVMTILLLICTEIFPKTFALKHAESMTMIVAKPLNLLAGFIAPLQVGLLGLTDRAVALFERMPFFSQDPFVTEEEIKMAVKVGHKEGVLAEKEGEIFKSIFEFGKTTVKEVMVPVEKIVAAPVGSETTDILKLIKKEGFSRIPIYRNSLDEIIGIVHAKDFVTYLGEGRTSSRIDLAKIVRPAYFVRESKEAGQLLRELQRGKIQMAIIVNEENHVSGLVTMEDLLEEIVGEIQDEYDME
ncbi:MAG: hemolysin family protein [bacterium]